MRGRLVAAGLRGHHVLTKIWIPVHTSAESTIKQSRIQHISAGCTVLEHHEIQETLHLFQPPFNSVDYGSRDNFPSAFHATAGLCECNGSLEYSLT